MSAFWINTLCAAHRWNPQVTYTVADFASKHFGDTKTKAAPSIDDCSACAFTIFMGIGLIVLADVSTAARRIACNGNASFLDPLLICAGLHKDHEAPRLSDGEYPACAAMTTGYVFRVENEATVHYLQRIGRSGHLTTLLVSSSETRSSMRHVAEAASSVCAVLTVLTLARLLWLADANGIAALLVYILVRFINMLVIRRRAMPGWKGKEEPGVRSDLLVLLSQDRWIRLQGMTDDMKATLAGSWLRQPNTLESLATIAATMLTYLNAAIVAGASTDAQIVLFALIVLTTLLLEVTYVQSTDLQMHGRSFTVSARQKYERRLDMAEALVSETGRDDWCEKMGIVLTSTESAAGRSTGPAHM